MGDTIETGGSSHYCEIPTDVRTEILVCLPVKSLLSFTVVCKSWLSLIRNNPQFAMRHYLAKVRPSPTASMDNIDFLVDRGEYGRKWNSAASEKVFRLRFYTLTKKKTLQISKRLEFGPGLDVCVSNFHNGLMCAYAFSSHSRRCRLLLCNPAIGEVVPLPSPPPHMLNKRGLPIARLGSDTGINGYKIVLVWASDSWEIDVYSIRDSTWRSLQANIPLDQFSSIECEPALNANGSILTWFGSLKSSPSQRAILSFDMRGEVFRVVEIPNCLNPESMHPYGYAESLVSVKQIMASRGEEEEGEGPICFVREVGSKNKVHWSYSFKLS